MLKNAPTLAIVAVHTEENEPPKILGPKFHYFNRLLTTHDRDFLRDLEDCATRREQQGGWLRSWTISFPSSGLRRGLS